MRPERSGGVAVEPMAGGSVRPRLWRTPTPYLFLGLAVVMGIIVVALLVLLCTRRKPSSSSPEQEADEKASSVRVLVPLDREPRVVVIMAGERAPSFLASAKPLELAPSGAAAEADSAAAV